MATNRPDRQEIYEIEKAARRELEQRAQRGDLSPRDADRALYDVRRMMSQGMKTDAIQKLAGFSPRDMERMMGKDPRSVMMIVEAYYGALGRSVGEKPKQPAGRAELEEARKAIKEMTEILDNIKKEALILHTIDRVSKDKKHTFVSKNGTEMRINAPEGLERGHEVLLHPKTMQIVENLGFPPLQASRFSPSEIPSVTWDDIGGLEAVKADMREAIEMPFTHKELFAYYNKRPVKGILLSGAPGCGKTMLGKAAANALAKIHGGESVATGFLYVKAPEILNQYVGQTEQTIRDMFMDANRHFEEHGYPAVIFIDEADAILATRGSRNIGLGNTIVPAFLTEMDGLESSTAIVILATNRPDILDPAIVREGRIDRKIHVLRPDQTNTKNIALLNLKRFPISSEYEMADLAEGLAAEIFNPERYIKEGVKLQDIVSGALIAACTDLAVSNAIQRDIVTDARSGLTAEDIIYAVERTQAQNAGVNHDFE